MLTTAMTARFLTLKDQSKHELDRILTVEGRYTINHAFFK